MVVEPDRIDAELFASLRAMQDLLVGEPHLRQVDPDLDLGHPRSSSRPSVMVLPDRRTVVSLMSGDPAAARTLYFLSFAW
jgi:hypothetical protein